MSIIAEAIGKCTRCGHNQQITIYKSINVSENPELKAKVKDGSLFVWECSECKEKNLAKYQTLYHDPSAKLMIWLLPEGQQENSKLDNANKRLSGLEGYTLRRVNDIGSLMEKVNIADARLDDIVMEMCKYVTKIEMGSKSGDNSNAAKLFSSTFRFYKLEDDAIVLSFPSNGEMSSIKIGRNVYEDCQGILGRNPSIRPDSGFVRIDADWLSDIMR